MTWLQWVAQNQYLLWTMRKSCMRHSGEATLRERVQQSDDE
jgi:hypothetical protein